MSIPVSRPTLHRKDLNSVLSCLVSDRIGPGELSAELAGGLSRQLGTSGGLCLSSYSAGIERLLDVLELGAGDSLAMSALTPAIYRAVCARRGIHTVLVDVEDGSTLPDVAALDRLLSAGRLPSGDAGLPGPGAADGPPKALILHYTLGFVPDTDEVLRLGIPVVEDLSHALGGSWNGGPCGSHGQLAILSLQPDGIITAGEGAALFARERKTARNLATIRGLYDEDRILPNMNAALGLAQLKELERFLRTRREVASAYLQAVGRSPHGALVAGLQNTGTEASTAGAASGEDAAVTYGFVVTVRGGLKEVRQYAAKRGVETRRAFGDAVLTLQESRGAVTDPAALSGDEGAASAPPDLATGEEAVQSGQRPFAGGAADMEAEGVARRFPRAYELLLRSLQFPLYPTLARKDVQLVAKVLASLP